MLSISLTPEILTAIHTAYFVFFSKIIFGLRVVISTKSRYSTSIFLDLLKLFIAFFFKSSNEVFV